LVKTVVVVPVTRLRSTVLIAVDTLPLRLTAPRVRLLAVAVAVTAMLPVEVAVWVIPVSTTAVESAAVIVRVSIAFAVIVPAVNVPVEATPALLNFKVSASATPVAVLRE